MAGEDTTTVTLVRVRRPWWQRLAIELASLVAALALLLGVALVVLDTAPGHRFLADRIARLETATGLTIRIGRIEGSIFGETRLRNVQVADPKGVFLVSPEIELDWAPGAWLYNQLYIDRLVADEVRLLRKPALRPGRPDQPILPGFDVYIGQLTIRHFHVEKGVAGAARVGRLDGAVDIRAGRALARARLGIAGGDRLELALDAEPDRDRFDLDLKANAPADGLLPALLGLKAPLALDVHGDGRWSDWRGTARLALSGREQAALDLRLAKGRARLNGTVRPAGLVAPRLARLLGAAVRVDGDARIDKRVLDGVLTLRSANLRAVARGKLDLADNRFGGVRVGVDLLRPEALAANLRGRAVRLVMTLDGRFDRADYSYRLTSPAITIDRTGFIDVRAEGRGQRSPLPMRIPLRLSARAVTGVGDLAEGLLTNSRIEGYLTLFSGRLVGDKLAVRSDRLNGTASLLVDFATGRFDLVLSGGIKRFLIPGLGLVDVTTDLKVVPGPGGKGSVITGRGRAQVVRFDNGFFRALAGGMPVLETDLSRGPDGVMRFSNLVLRAPDLVLKGSGTRSPDGRFQIVASGVHRRYGPVRLRLDGPIARPDVTVLLARPNAALGLADVTVDLKANGEGYALTARGQSRLGPFDGTGRLALPKGAPAVLFVDRLNVAGTTARGRLDTVPGGLAGPLAVAGGGIDGTVDLSVGGDAVQRIGIHLALSGAQWPGPPAVRIASGRIDSTVALGRNGTTMDLVANARGLSSGAATLSQLTLSGRLVDGAGTLRFAAAGRRGTPFDLKGTAEVAPDAVTIRAEGDVARRPLRFDTPARIERRGDGWQLDPVRLRYAGGAITLSGATGATPTLRAELAQLPLNLLDLAMPKLGLSGLASGTLDYRLDKGQRRGTMALTVRGLSRAGLVLASKPIDLGLNASIDGPVAGFRAVARSDGKLVGRAQGRFAPVARTGGLLAALRAAPSRIQLRYAGPADTLWRLSGIEVFDLSGPLSLGLDLDGSLDGPRIAGALRADGVRIESAVTGTVVKDISANGRFTGSLLTLTDIRGVTPDGGSVAGAGRINFAGGLPDLDLSFTARNARLIDRDDIAASVSGPFAIRSEGRGGVISGDLKLDRGRFQLGRASAAASVPQLAVRDIGGDTAGVITTAQLSPWRLAVKLSGGPLTVTGLGIDSRWTTDLDIGGRADAPALTGTAILDRGTYEFAGRSFRLDRGTIRFRGQSPPNPLLDISARAEVQGLDARVEVGGTGLNPEIRFSSTPPLPQDELLSRLLFGTSITNLSAPEALQLAAAVSALRSGQGGLDPINAVRRAIGLDRLRIVPADIATGNKTAISAGKYLGKKLFVEVITDGQGYSATRIEYQVTRWLSLLSSVSTLGRASANVRVQKEY